MNKFDELYDSLINKVYDRANVKVSYGTDYKAAGVNPKSNYTKDIKKNIKKKKESKTVLYNIVQANKDVIVKSKNKKGKQHE